MRRLKVGDKVYSYSWANPKGGFYAQYVAVAADKVAPIPRRLDLEHAGAIATTGLTALQGVDDTLRLKKGESVIIHGASGGVGTLAIQFARLRGARVLATASGLDGIELVRDMGADAAVDGRHGDIEGAARQFARTVSTPCWHSPAVTGWRALLRLCAATAASPTRTVSNPNRRSGAA